MEKEVIGTVVSVAKQWWLKVNSKPLRTHALDGATFPRIIKVKYVVNGKEYICRKWISTENTAPSKGSTIKVFYHVEKPSKARVEI